jgi:hypothetical protein
MQDSQNRQNLERRTWASLTHHVVVGVPQAVPSPVLQQLAPWRRANATGTTTPPTRAFLSFLFFSVFFPLLLALSLAGCVVRSPSSFSLCHDDQKKQQPGSSAALSHSFLFHVFQKKIHKHKSFIRIYL